MQFWTWIRQIGSCDLDHLKKSDVRMSSLFFWFFFYVIQITQNVLTYVWYVVHVQRLMAMSVQLEHEARLVIEVSQFTENDLVKAASCRKHSKECIEQIKSSNICYERLELSQPRVYVIEPAMVQVRSGRVVVFESICRQTLADIIEGVLGS